MAVVKKVAYYTYSPYPLAWEQIRVISPLKILGIELIEGVSNGIVSLNPINDAELVILERNFPGGFSQSIKVIEAAHNQGKPVVMNLDDDLLNLDFDHPDLINSSFAFELVPILFVLRAVDAVIVTTPLLQSAIAQHNDHVYVLPNYLDDSIWPIKKIKRTDQNFPLTLMYFGTQSHRLDIEMISEPLKDLALKYPGKLNFIFYGTNAPTSLKNLAKVSFYPSVTHEYREFVKLIREFDADIAFAPLRDTVFNRNKSPLKYFEYTALGLPAVFSDIPPYKGVVQKGKTGLMAGSSEEWQDRLTSLVEHPDLRNTILEQAQDDIKQNHLLSNHVNDWCNVYNEVVERGIVNQTDRVINLNLLEKIGHFVETASNHKAQQNSVLKQEINDKAQQNSMLRQEIEDKDRQNSILEQENEDKARQNALLKQEVDNLQNSLHDSVNELIDNVTSTSWKITRPMRKVMRELRRR